MGVILTKEQLNTPLAELELYGMSIREINALETELDCMYVKDLEGVEVSDLLAIDNIGKTLAANTQRALQNFVARNRIKTPRQCIVLKKDKD